MPSLLHRYATPLVTGLFLISLVSGVALFVHVGQGTFREMHEVLSMVLIVPFALHLWRNWRPMLGYLRRPPMLATLGASLALALAFAIPAATGGAAAGGREGPPQFALAAALLDDTPAAVAPVLGTTEAELDARLEAAGLPVPSPEATLAEIGAAAGASDQAVLAALLPA